jgi:proteasome lid subunit RPN8/RPN11
MTSVIFSNPTIENRFRRQINNSENEIGGYFLTRFEPITWPGLFSWKQTKEILGDRINFIEQVIVLPNKAKTPHVAWSTWSMDLAHELAMENARFNDTYPIHFHTHPNGNPEPSQPDLAFAGAWCKMYDGFSQFCIVTPHPLRVHYYSLEFGRTSVPNETKVERGEFFSWRSIYVKALVF